MLFHASVYRFESNENATDRPTYWISAFTGQFSLMDSVIYK